MILRTPADFGAAVRDRRKALGWNQGRLAATVGVTRQWIAEVEKGKPRAEVGLVLRTLAALDITLTHGRVAPPTGSPDGDEGYDIDQVVADARKRA